MECIAEKTESQCRTFFSGCRCPTLNGKDYWTAHWIPYGGWRKKCACPQTQKTQQHKRIPAKLKNNCIGSVKHCTIHYLKQSIDWFLEHVFFLYIVFETPVHLVSLDHQHFKMIDTKRFFLLCIGKSINSTEFRLKINISNVWHDNGVVSLIRWFDYVWCLPIHYHFKAWMWPLASHRHQRQHQSFIYHVSLELMMITCYLVGLDALWPCLMTGLSSTRMFVCAKCVVKSAQHRNMRMPGERSKSGLPYMLRMEENCVFLISLWF